jgi:NADH:ubiquinone oxidoreductase subunit H
MLDCFIIVILLGSYIKTTLIAFSLWSYGAEALFLSVNTSVRLAIHTLSVTLMQVPKSYFASTILCKYVAWASIVFALKFILLVALLVFVRGGIPRYRYDFLTKVGWIQMLNFILLVLFLLIWHYLSL